MQYTSHGRWIWACVTGWALYFLFGRWTALKERKKEKTKKGAGKMECKNLAIFKVKEGEKWSRWKRPSKILRVNTLKTNTK